MFKVLTEMINKLLLSDYDANFNLLWDKNEVFLSTISEKEKVKLFEYIKSYAEIVYAKEKFFHPEISKFFNVFFSKYETISIGKSTIIDIKNLNITDHIILDGVLSIGYDINDYIFIKKNDELNNIYIETLDFEDSILEDKPSNPTLYHYLIKKIGIVYKLDLKQKYEEMRIKNK